MLSDLPEPTVAGVGGEDEGDASEEEVRAALATFCGLPCYETREGAEIAAHIKSMTAYPLLSERQLAVLLSEMSSPSALKTGPSMSEKREVLLR